MLKNPDFGSQNNFLELSVPKTLKHFFLFSLLALFFYNVSGIRVCLEHAEHKSSITQKSDTSDKDSVSKDDGCQCALHFQMNNVLFEETVSLAILTESVVGTKLFPTEEKTCYQLLDYFSSRAPPASFLS